MRSHSKIQHSRNRQDRLSPRSILAHLKKREQNKKRKKAQQRIVAIVKELPVDDLLKDGELGGNPRRDIVEIGPRDDMLLDELDPQNENLQRR